VPEKAMHRPAKAHRRGHAGRSGRPRPAVVAVQVTKIFCRCEPLSARPYTDYKVLLVRLPAPDGLERWVT